MVLSIIALGLEKNHPDSSTSFDRQNTRAFVYIFKVAFFCKLLVNKQNTHVELPNDFVNARFGIDTTFKVNIVTLLDVVRVQGRTKTKLNSRQICRGEERKE